MEQVDVGLWGVLIAILGGAIRVSTPFIFVSLGELLTERSGRFNLGLEGTLVFGAMSGYAVAYETNSAFVGVLAAAAAGACFGLLHGWICKFKGVNDIAVGIAMMLLGMGLAFFFGKPYIQPQAPDLPAISLGWWSDIPQLRAALEVNGLFIVGGLLALAIAWMLRTTRMGLRLRVVGDSTDAARAMGLSPDRIRLLATGAGGAMVIFARWNPINCFWAALLFGGAGALGPALQSVGITEGYYLFGAAPYALTLGLLILTSAPDRAVQGAPLALTLTK